MLQLLRSRYSTMKSVPISSRSSVINSVTPEDIKFATELFEENNLGSSCGAYRVTLKAPATVRRTIYIPVASCPEEAQAMAIANTLRVWDIHEVSIDAQHTISITKD